MKISIVIPALNEEAGIESVIRQIPTEKLKASEYETEIIVVDNGSEDRTAELARRNGAKVVSEPSKGYGNAYKAGFKNANGDIIVTGDADMTYPFDETKRLVDFLICHKLDFLNTNRLEKVNPGISARIHAVGTHLLTFAMKTLFRCPFRDSQSGMWIFRRVVWETISVQSSGMSFSQEIKIEAFLKGFRCGEISIEYRPRIGESKLNTFSDGWKAMTHLIQKRFRNRKKKISNFKNAQF